jgi:hypothetical protein
MSRGNREQAVGDKQIDGVEAEEEKDVAMLDVQSRDKLSPAAVLGIAIRAVIERGNMIADAPVRDSWNICKK